MRKKRICEAIAYLVVVGAGAGIAIPSNVGPEAHAVASLAKYVIAAWIVVRCRMLCVSLPAATLAFWTLTIGPEMLALHKEAGGSAVLSYATSFPTYFSLFGAALYSNLCYAVASVFHAVWSRQERPGKFRTVIALVSAAQLGLAVAGILFARVEPYGVVLKGTPVLLFLCLGLGSVPGFALGRNPSMGRALLYSSWIQAAVWLGCMLLAEQFAPMTYTRGRWRGESILPMLSFLAFALCVSNGLLLALIPTGEVDKKTSGRQIERTDTPGERTG